MTLPRRFILVVLDRLS
jgi:hypothetical protein